MNTEKVNELIKDQCPNERGYTPIIDGSEDFWKAVQLDNEEISVKFLKIVPASDGKNYWKWFTIPVNKIHKEPTIDQFISSTRQEKKPPFGYYQARVRLREWELQGVADFD